MNLRKKNTRLATILLRVGLAFVFFYAAIDSLHQPLLWESYLPSLLLQHVNVLLALKVVSIYEIALALWLLSGKFVRYAALLAALTLAGIIAVNLGQFLVTFRDVGLLFAAVALYFSAD